MAEELTPLDAIEEPTWRALARFFVVAPRLLDEDLQRGAHMSLSAYSILMHLSEAPRHTLRMTDLANRAYLSSSRTTRLLDELIADQLVTKERKRHRRSQLRDLDRQGPDGTHPGLSSSPAQRARTRPRPRLQVHPAVLRQCGDRHC
jgi:hypothetical protein